MKSQKFFIFLLSSRRRFFIRWRIYCTFAPRYKEYSMKFDTVVFDLDGTLLDTLGDLATSVNYALTSHGLPARSLADVRSFLGNGIRYLMEHAAGDAAKDETFELVFQAFREHYVKHCLDTTAPYPGIMSLLAALRKIGVRMAIVSNKLHPAVQELNERFFKGYITSAVGESATVRRKPNPDAVLAALKQLGSTPEKAIYVGDSEVDLATANNAGLPCALVLWGFRDEAFLRSLPGVSAFLSKPEDLLKTIF